MSHSPFPWSTHPQVRTSVFNAYGVKVATTTGPNAEDNAALIAAIPAMVEMLQNSEKTFEAIRKVLINNLAEPERKAFWDAVAARDDIRAILKSIGKKP